MSALVLIYPRTYWGYHGLGDYSNTGGSKKKRDKELVKIIMRDSNMKLAGLDSPS